MSHAELPDYPPVPRLVRSLNSGGLFAAGEVVIARAPGRLDVMGGVADYSGSLVCEMPLAEAAAAAVQRRRDGQLVCRSAQLGRTVTLRAADVAAAKPADLRALLSGEDRWARYPLGCVWRLPGQASITGGLTLLVDSDVPLGGGVSSSAAIEVATMTALAAVLNISMTPLELAVACQQVENQVVGAPCGVMDQVTSCMGEDHALLEILCQPGADGLPAQVLGVLRVPAGYAFIGIHSGVSHDVSGDPYTDTRVAAFMGQKILSLLEAADLTAGHLANVPADRYHRELRERLPVAMTGQAFLDLYRGTNDPVTAVRPEQTYHVRAAADHHVLEADRVRRFVELLDGRGSAGIGALQERMAQAGALMVESHHSYGQCARLGHPMTDRLVEMVQALGPEQGFFGAKITGGGSGGTVAVLVRDEPAVMQRAEALRQQYTNETGHPTMLFTGTSPGAAAWGVRRISLGVSA